MAAMDQLTSLSQLIQSVQGQKQSGTSKTSGTKTTQTNISDAGISQLLDQILSGPGGVKSVGNAARASGLYNSTTEDKKLGELYSDAALKAELARSPTTTSESSSTSTTAQTGGVGLGTLGTLVGGLSAANSLFKLLGGGSSAGGAGASLGGGGLLDSLGGLFGGSASGGSAGGFGQLGGLFGGGSQLGGLLSGFGSGAGGASAGGFGQLGNLFSGSGIFGGGAEAGAASAGLSGIPGVGSFFSGLLGGKNSTDPGNLASSAATGFAVGGPVGAIAAPVAMLTGGLLGGASVICTALHRKGLISQELHNAGHQYLVTLHPMTRLGYYLWAEKIAAKIDKGSKFWKYLMVVPTWCYLSLLASDRGTLDYLENPIGAAVKLIGEPLCPFLGSLAMSYKLHKMQEN